MCDVCGCDSLEYHGGRRPRDVNEKGSALNPEGSRRQGGNTGAPGGAAWLRQERKEG